MAKKKHLKGIDETEMEIIDEKMAKGVDNSLQFTRQLKMLSYKLDIKCKTEIQKAFLNELKDKTKEICFGVGSPGTGKSFISLSYALKELKEGNYDKIIMIVPTAPAGGVDLHLGYLKGELEDKVKPYKAADMETITKILKLSGNYDASQISEALVNNGCIKYEFINFLLGKTLDNAIILVNEAEQYTKENLKLILTRIGENCKVIITGDCEQVNRNSIVKNKDVCGLYYATNVLTELEEISVTEFTKDDIVRNKLITKILELWK